MLTLNQILIQLYYPEQTQEDRAELQGNGTCCELKQQQPKKTLQNTKTDKLKRKWQKWKREALLNNSKP